MATVKADQVNKFFKRSQFENQLFQNKNDYVIRILKVIEHKKNILLMVLGECNELAE